MNRTKLKNYAPQARRDFIQAMIDRAAFYGLTAKKTEPIEVRGDSAVIAGSVFPKSVAEKRQKLEKRIKRHGFDQTMEALAYTWFNRLVAIRFMELHGYLDHGYRVLSHPEGKPTPEILEHAEHVELAGLKKEAVIDLKLAANMESELYRTLLIAQCNALHSAMPFLFEKIEDETELLLPENLLHSDSLIRKLVEEIEEEDWQEVEIIGWLYQFYISEKKDQVIGKVVATEDIPAATQLFTPNWIVKYLVQNTLGRQWLATYPESPLRKPMEYYIEPAEQTPEVQDQLKEITPTSLDPEKITLLDPACGSGHILVEAYDLFKAIYLERGYRAKDIPALILEKNLFGLEIDDRAAQLAAFALMMKARADDRRIFESEAKPNVVAFQDSHGMDAADITHALNSPIRSIGEGHVSELDIDSLLELFENAKTFGSLIQVPPKLMEKLSVIEDRLNEVIQRGDLTHSSARIIEPLLRQARLLERRYDAVVANPPYMGGKFFTGILKQFVGKKYKDSKFDLYACFIRRNLSFAKENCFVGMITIPNWMFLSSFGNLRESLIAKQTIDTFIHNGRGVFGSDFGSCSFVIRNQRMSQYRSCFRRLLGKQGSVASNEELTQRYFTAPSFYPRSIDFENIPNTAFAYWASDKLRKHFCVTKPLGEIAECRLGLATADDGRFLRLWHEVDFGNIGFECPSRVVAQESKKKWFPFNKGGAFRKWYGNNDFVVDWSNDGAAIKNNIITRYPYLNGNPEYVAKNTDYYFRGGITWSLISISMPSFRNFPDGFIIGHKGPGVFLDPKLQPLVIGFLNSKVAVAFLELLSPSVGFEIGQIKQLPMVVNDNLMSSVPKLVDTIIIGHRDDWDSIETSSGFHRLSLLSCAAMTLSDSLDETHRSRIESIAQLKKSEEHINRLLIEAYELEDQISPELPDDQITLDYPSAGEDIKRLLSYAVGCIMGRYSLDKPGLIYAYSGNQGFDPTQYITFRADDDGIVPLLESDWGIRDDAANRVVEFIGVGWDKEHLEENLEFIAESLDPSKGEQPRETIRRYLATGYYKHHLSMYKRRPIYWLFSSGKQRAFQCLVYLHRYNEVTLARMRNEYVIPLQGMMSSRIEQLAADLAKATSTSHRKNLQKEQDRLKKQQAELLAFDEKLKHYADQRIVLDLDDGVRVNYGKFGDLLAEVKAVTGGKSEE